MKLSLATTVVNLPLIILIFWSLGLAIIGIRELSDWRLRRKGIMPPRGQATIADVERLLKSGRRGEAVRCYREIHPRTGLSEAIQAVNALSPNP